MSTHRPVITVDGLAGTGKTTLSVRLASHFGFVHLSTGLLYRTVGYLALKQKVSRSNGGALAELVGKHEIRMILSPERSARIVLDRRDIFEELYTPDVSEATSEVAIHKEVRAALVALQRDAFPGEGLVAEGRDMGTVIFPDAEVKFWIETDINVKVARRLQQLIEKEGIISDERRRTLEQSMQKEIFDRDRRDQERGLAPTLRASDMIVVDNSTRQIAVVVDEMVRLLHQHGFEGKNRTE